MQLIHANRYRDATMYTILSSGAHNPELTTPILGLFYETAFSQISLFLASFCSTFPAKEEAPSSVCAHP